jgi:hypothetical protein
VAYIDVEPRRPRWWTWALALLLLLLLGWLAVTVLRGRDRWWPDRTPAMPPIDSAGVAGSAPASTPLSSVADTLATVPELPAAVAEYVAVCGSGGSDEGVSLAACLDRLASALEEVVRRDTVGSEALEPRLERFRRLAAAAQSDTTAPAVRPALVSAAALLAALQQSRRFPALGLDAQLRGVCAAADAGRARGFFHGSAEALRLMY